MTASPVWSTTGSRTCPTRRPIGSSPTHSIAVGPGGRLVVVVVIIVVVVVEVVVEVVEFGGVGVVLVVEAAVGCGPSVVVVTRVVATSEAP